MSSYPAWFDADDDRTARAAWSRLTEPCDLVATRWVESCGAARTLGHLLSGGGPARGEPGSEHLARWTSRLSCLDPTRDLRTLQNTGGRLLVPGDPQWPSDLELLGERRPLCLWVNGAGDLGRAAEKGVCLVGARASTGYGERVARNLVVGCVERGYSIVSGAAYGIDGTAHRAALAVDGLTVGVLACGVDRVYPRGHEHLFSRIRESGCLVSEIPPGSAPTRWRFIRRNRLIAALGRVTVVVEAAWRSGTMITAREAAELGRPVGAVPGPVTSAASAGCHRLLRDGATCITDAAEVAEMLAPIGADLSDSPPAPAAEHDGLPCEDLRVLDAVPLRKPVALTALCRSAGLADKVVVASLGRLALRGLVHRDSAGWQRCGRDSARGAQH
ncbi:MAG: DNA-processing protein DprA [Actinomycetota bacterium]|nr:DNA-processing protein DprA [Actinomycetota bacterium]